MIEVDAGGWAAFKALEAVQRKAYSVSEEARLDHGKWVVAKPSGNGWQSAPEWSIAEPRIVPNPHELKWEDLYDWSLEPPADDADMRDGYV
ncbi:hypothetical protein OVA24_20250 [Luteolibacter sp. SL250]|uniref:hypothetical protein n=1 Tax=Luteolibacter sp. SL250 TaxID=2995170 RepID=UPI002271AE63|nr:hypothetical protein [Luteolibacter sp. SL250]WAC19559.1 hypothetical protein OVA24_20250 [Luteolibacter sp. SL250]